MKKWLFTLGFTGFSAILFAQSISSRLEKATKNLTEDSQMTNASLSFYVADADNGEKVFDYNGNIGLSPASTQKIFTAIAGYELLGQDFRFKTEVGYNGSIVDNVLAGDLIIKGYGDPTLGSWIYDGYRVEDVHKKIKQILFSKGIQKINGNVIIDDGTYFLQPTPQGWPWGDMGNYYGAPCWGFNWLENQYDITFKPGAKVGQPTSILKFNQALPSVTFFNKTTTAEAGSGDQSSVFLPPYGNAAIITGTLPLGKNTVVSGAIPNPPALFAQQLQQWFAKDSIACLGRFLPANELLLKGLSVPSMTVVLDSLSSPKMDDMVYYFLQKSINLYGESLVKAISYKKNKLGETEDGVGIVRTFWENQGIPKNTLKMRDGSGLSPQNYDAASAEVKALLFARQKPWFTAFYKALPTYNGTKMKSGTIAMCKGFAGYQKSSDGKTYVFSIIINNYNGNHDPMVNKMFKLLDVLK